MGGDRREVRLVVKMGVFIRFYVILGKLCICFGKKKIFRWSMGMGKRGV